MIIIAFSKHTSKLLPKLVCKNFKHCAPILWKKNKSFTLLQYVNAKKVIPIQLSEKDLNILENFGWHFIYLGKVKKHKIKTPLTCVQFTKQLIGINKPFIQTPDGLYKLFLQ